MKLKITKTQIRKGLGGILKAFGLYKWEGLRKSFWQKNTTKALYLWKVSPATIWRIDGRRGVLEEGIPVRHLWVKLKQGNSAVRTKVVTVALGMEKCPGFRRHLEITQPSLLHLLQYREVRVQFLRAFPNLRSDTEHPLSASSTWFTATPPPSEGPGIS